MEETHYPGKHSPTECVLLPEYIKLHCSENFDMLSSSWTKVVRNKV